MKTTFAQLLFVYTLFAILFCQVSIVTAQVPQSIPYQAAARDNSGNAIVNQNISLRFTIHDVTANGTAVYTEIQSTVTSALGLLSVNIGQGSAVTGTFSLISWGTNSKFLQVEMDATGGSSYADMGTTQLLSVPYALYAEKSAAASNGVPNGMANGNTLRWNGISWVVDSTFTNKQTNVGIGTTAPSSSALLDLSSTNKGFTMPRMTTAQRDAIADPVVGLQVFNTDDQCVNIYDGAHWIETCGFRSSDNVILPGGNVWAQKANFGGTGRFHATGFSIGSKGYVGTGSDGSGYRNDFWEYDPSTDSWTQKADFGGTARAEATGFSIGNKGYIGTGYGNGFQNDFWEYDPLNNSWTQKADFGGTARADAIGFSINNKGYIGTGYNNNCIKDFWEYDPSTNSWTQKADVGGSVRAYATGFSIGSKGYVGTGNDGFFSLGDFWEYDPSSNTWTQKANFGGSARYQAAGFSIGSKGYIGTGGGGSNDFWEYNPSTNAWIQKANFGGTGRSGAVGFSISGKGYIGTGYSGGFSNDFWEYSPEVTGSSYSAVLPSSATSVSDGAWTISGTTIYNSNSGNVGIGTSSPSTKLDVSGGINSSSGYMIGGTATAGNYLRGNGAMFVPAPLSASDLAGVMSVDHGGTGAAALTGYLKGNNTSAFTASATIPGSDINGNISGNATNVTGVVAVSNGGSGAATLSGYLKGNGTSAFTASSTIPGSAISGNITGNAANVTSVVAVANGGSGAGTLSGYIKGNGTSAFTASSTIPASDVNGNISGNAANVSGTVTVLHGGTGVSTLSGYLKGNGTSAFTASSTIPASDVSGNISGNAANVTGLVAVANGGSGATTLSGYLKGNGTSAFTASSTIPASDVNGNISGNAANVTGLVAVANGGSGAATLSGYLKGNGTSAFTASSTIPASDVSGNISGNAVNVTGLVAVANGGSGAATLSGYLKGNGTSAFTASSFIPGSDVGGNISGNAANVTGTVGVLNGGTGVAGTFPPGSMVFAGSGGIYSQDNSNLFWDNSNDRLGIGTSSPSARLDVNGSGWFRTDVNSNLPSTAGKGNRLFFDASLDAGQLYSYDYATGVSKNLILQLPGGNLGIGTTSVTHAKVEINGSQNTSLSYGFLNPGGSTGTSSGTNGYSLYCSNRIAATEFNAFSDARIKHILGSTDNQNDLATLMKIGVTDYSFIDTIAKGNKVYKKVIAQEVEKIYPAAVSTTHEFIPDVYKLSSIDKGFIALSDTSLKPGNKVKLIFADGEQIVVVKSVTQNGFFTECNKEGNVFVYGKEVDDFRTVDYEALSMLNISATQALVRKIDLLEKDNALLKTDNASIKSDNAAIKTDIEEIKSQLGMEAKAEK